MVPKVSKRGTSFKGALAYYLHDKREEGEIERHTTERVDWTETRGFHKDNIDPELAGHIMAATAMDQDRLKAQAGVRRTGQKSKGAVYAYSIAWHPDEHGKIDRAEMLNAADQSLKAIGAGDRQAIIVAHNDEPHPHVHVIVNLVSPEDGRNLSVHADRNKLSKWALSYRKARGEEELYCPKRNERAEAAKKKRAGQDVDFVGGEKSRPRSSESDYARAKAADPKAAKAERDRQKAADATLSLQGRSQAHRHKRESVDLDDRLKFKKAEIKSHAKDAIARNKEQIKEQYRPVWRELYRDQYKEKRFFEKREQRLAGKVENALLVIAHRRQIDPDGSRGFMGHAFNFLTSKKARAEALEKLHRVDQRKLSKEQREAVGAAVSAVKADRSALLSQANSSYDSDRIALIERQAFENDQLKAKWHQRTAERSRAYDAIVKKVAAKRSAKAEPEAQNQAKEDFTRATKYRRRPRGRSQKRDRD